MARVEIEYCVPCGLLERAEDVQHALLSEYGQRLDAVALKTGDDGVFEVRVDGEDVYAKEEDEFDVDRISDRVGDRL
ncbi:Rdx family protein [Halomicrococcus gelatinilyticus]|uniref:Rdx family protein n=1 Tax=Halomicrococcus gelatinilyticus TaxID=1702103 RepID=UPI002E0D0F08